MRLELFAVLFAVVTVNSFVCKDCKISTVKRMKSADCYKGEITKVPRCHTNGIEILDLSYNRIREIGKHDLDTYPYMQILYLSENILNEIDNDALADKTYLHTLDLSSNAFYNIPSAIFHLPSLEKLYLADIRNAKMVDDIEAAAPVTSPLVKLDLSSNKLVRLPRLGDVPTLLELNVTNNANVLVNVSAFAGLCNLKHFINDGFSAYFDDPCDCYYLNEWLDARGVIFNKIQCEQIVCNGTISEDYVATYKACRKTHEERQLQLFKQNLLINTGIVAGVIIGLLTVTLVWIYRSRKKKSRKAIEANQRKSKQYSDDRYS